MKTYGKHGMRHSPEYKAWCHIKERCYNPKSISYPHYGGRGVTVCDRWLNSFANFFSDLGYRPGHDYSIDRINNNGNYEPSNCKWSTLNDQARNKTSTIKVIYNNIEMCLAEACRLAGAKYKAIFARMKYRGLTFNQALTMPKYVKVK